MKAAHTVISVPGSLACFLDSAHNMVVSEERIVEVDALSDLRKLTSETDCEPSTLQHAQELGHTYGSAVLSDVRTVQQLILDALVALASADMDVASFANLNKEHDSDKAEWEGSLNRYTISSMSLIIVFRSLYTVNKPLKSWRISSKSLPRL